MVAACTTGRYKVASFVGKIFNHENYPIIIMVIIIIAQEYFDLCCGHAGNTIKLKYKEI